MDYELADASNLKLATLNLKSPAGLLRSARNDEAALANQKLKINNKP
jgi:hypothetical protein